MIIWKHDFCKGCFAVISIEVAESDFNFANSILSGRYIHSLDCRIIFSSFIMQYAVGGYGEIFSIKEVSLLSSLFEMLLLKSGNSVNDVRVTCRFLKYSST